MCIRRVLVCLVRMLRIKMTGLETENQRGNRLTQVDLENGH